MVLGHACGGLRCGLPDGDLALRDDGAGLWAFYGKGTSDARVLVRVGGVAREVQLASVADALEPVPTRGPDRAIAPPEQRDADPDWAELLGRWADWSVPVMLRIMRCESGFDANAVSPDGRNVGAYQENIVHGYSYAEMTDPFISTEIAHDIWLSQGYAAWSCWG